MKQFKALIKKEWQTHWSTIIAPLWFIGGVYAIALLGVIVSLIKGNGWIQMGGDVPAEMANYILWNSTAGLTMLIGTVGIVSAIILADSMLNGGYKRRCEILHLSQPVCLGKIVGAKYLLLSLGTISLIAVLSLVNSFAASLLAGYKTGASLFVGLSGCAQGFIEISLSLLFVSSLYWFFAGVFKRKSFFMGTLTILAIQVSISILNYTAGLHIPSLLSYIARLAAVNINVNPPAFAGGINNISALIDAKWQQFFVWDSVMKLVYSVIFYFGGFFMYKNRELS
ncbi:MAG: hypothetical protein PHO32_06420 [Candidatus Cloacimonetes bacterium]|nr:hypothetical protein [Candidatus Cloacimonadota bacterium]